MIKECKGKTLQETAGCRNYRSFSSLRFSNIYRIKISEIHCDYCGDKVYDENGNVI